MSQLLPAPLSAASGTKSCQPMARVLPVDDSSLVEVVQSEGDLRRIEPAQNISV
jgi:hypothetical protein